MKNLLTVTETDTIGTALVKGAVKGYIQGTVIGALGIGAMVTTVYIIGRYAESEEELKELNDKKEELEKEDERILKLVNGHIKQA